MTIINKRHCEGFARGNPEKFWSTKVDPTSTNVKFIQSYPPRIKRAYGWKLLVSALRTLLGGRCLGFCFTKSRNSLHYVVAHLTFRYFGVPLRFSLHKIRKKKPSKEG